jgi:GNAT superfamily N-acetyltransferase
VALAFTPVAAHDAADLTLREQLLDTWVRVVDAGGAVGFVPPADPTAVGETLDTALRRVSSGQDALGVLRAGDGRAVGMGILSASTNPLRQHWRTVLRLMVDPDLQGTGGGRILMEGLHRIARDLNLEFLCLSVRGGLAIEGFYGHLGYEICGCIPRAIRVAPGDARDEIQLRRPL